MPSRVESSSMFVYTDFCMKKQTNKSDDERLNDKYAEA